MAEEEKKEGAVPPRLDLRKSVVVKPSSGQAPVTAPAALNASAPSVAPAVMAPKPAVPVQPEVHAPSAPQPMPMPAPKVSSPVPVPVNQAPAAVKPAQPVVPQPVSAVRAPQANQAPSNILKPASSPVPVKPLASSGGPITLKAGAPMVKPLQPLNQGQANVQAPFAASVAPATPVAPVVPAAPVAPAAPAPAVPAASPALSAAPVVMVPKPAAPVQPAAASGGPSPAVRPGGVSPLKPSAAPVNPLRPAGAKPTLKIGAMPSAQAKTIRLTPGGAQPKAPVRAGAVVVQGAKKETSKIPLDAAQPAVGAAVKTPTGPIELKPNEADGKRKTSRISLESVLAADDAQSPDSGPSSGPKTIKLKRPSEAVTIKAIKKGPVVARPAEPVAVDLSKTAPLDEIADGATASGKRTVKVRRPSMKIKAGGGAVGGEGDGASPVAAAAAKGKAAEAVYEDTAHWVFWLFSLAAVLVVSVMTYMFTSQVIGPDYSLTKASYYTEGYNLDWPYKLSKMP